MGFLHRSANFRMPGRARNSQNSSQARNLPTRSGVQAQLFSPDNVASPPMICLQPTCYLLLLSACPRPPPRRVSIFGGGWVGVQLENLLSPARLALKSERAYRRADGKKEESLASSKLN